MEPDKHKRKATMITSPENKLSLKIDPLSHVPRYDKTKELPDDVLDELEILQALIDGNADRAAKASKK